MIQFAPWSNVFGKRTTGWYRGQVSQANQPQRIHFGRTQAGSTSHPKRHHGSHPSATHPSQRERSYRSPSNRCRSERGFRPRTPTASRSTRSPSLIKHRGPSCRLPQREAMAALSTPRSFGHARGFYITASAQAECYHSISLNSKSPG